MAITDAGLHILSAAKVRAESMKASLDPHPPPADLSDCNVCVWRWVTALSGPYWWNGSGSCAVSPPQISCRLIRFHNVSVKVINTLPVHGGGGGTMLGSIDFPPRTPLNFFYLHVLVVHAVLVPPVSFFVSVSSDFLHRSDVSRSD